MIFHPSGIAEIGKSPATNLVKTVVLGGVSTNNNPQLEISSCYF